MSHRSLHSLLFLPVLLVAWASEAGCGTSLSPNGANGSGTCPCNVGNSGIQYTLACGEDACVTLNGTATGYRCESDGTHVDPTVCEAGFDAGTTDAPSGFDSGGGTGIDSGNAHADGALPPVPDGSVAADECQSGNDAGTCGEGADPVCECNTEVSCSFTCGASVGSVAAIRCPAFGTCGVQCLGGCSVDCLQATSCNVQIAGSGTVNCTQTKSCAVTIGAGDTVNCTQAGTCQVTCEGACTVDCTEATSCKVSCVGGVTGCDVQCIGGAPVTCPDGVTLACSSTDC